MKKFSKIFENKSNLFSTLGTSEDEIKDMCSELIDEGYNLSMDVEYIGLNGRIYRDTNKTKQYYPSIDIELNRPTSDKDGYDEGETKEQFKDVRNWNGGVYYESNINLLKSIYDLCYRFESTFTSDKADVFFSMRSINEISIRITFGLESSKSPLDFSAVKEFITNGFLDSINDGDYVVVDNFIWGDDKRMGVTISNKRDSVPIKRIIDRVIKSGDPDDEEYLYGIFKSCVDDVYNFCKKQNSKIELRYNSKSQSHIRSGGDKATIYMGDFILLEIKADFDETSTREVVVARGIFKDKKVKVNGLKMDINVKFGDFGEGVDLSTTIEAL